VLYPGVAEGIAALHDAGHWLAVATNKDQEACEKILDHYGLRRFMRSVMGGGSVRNLKPHPEMLVATMRKLAMAPADAWMVGDHVTDLQCARLAGVKSAFMSYGIGTPEGETPTLTFASFGEFVRAFVSEG
jgi:phosphoglycolate phosphatase